MEGAEKIVALNAYKPCLRILKAYNLENFKQISWAIIVRNLSFAICVTLVCALVPLAIVLAIWYLYDNSENIKLIVIGAPVIITVLQWFLSFVELVLKNRSIDKTIVRIQNVINQRCKDSVQSFQQYTQVEEKNSFLAIFIEKGLLLMIIIVFAPPVLCPVSYAIFDYPPPHLWLLPIQIHSLSASDNCYIPFLVDWAIECFSIYSSSIIAKVIGSLYVGLCLYVGGMVVDMKTRMTISVFGTAHEIDHKSRWSTIVREISFHNEIINVAQSVSYIMEFIIFTMAIASTIDIALCLFVLDLFEFISIETLIAFVNLTVVLVIMFIFYFLSEWLTSDLLEIGEIFYNLPWYKLPTKEQRLLTLPIQRAHRVFRLKGMGLFDCSLFVFSSIIRTAGSYFIILRSFK